MLNVGIMYYDGMHDVFNVVIVVVFVAHHLFQ